MSRNAFAVLVATLALFAWGAVALADYGIEECPGGGYECTNCAADPVFIQRDARDPVTLAKLRRIKAIREAVAASFDSSAPSVPKQEEQPDHDDKGIVLRIDLSGGWHMSERRSVEELPLTDLPRGHADEGETQQ